MTVIKYKDQRNEEQEIIATVPAQIVPVDHQGYLGEKWFVGFKKDGRYNPIIIARFENETRRDVAIHILQKAIEHKKEVFVLEGMEADRNFSRIVER